MKIQPGTTPAKSKYRITVTEKGPYIVYGSPPLKEYAIYKGSGELPCMLEYIKDFDSHKEPMLLCRCGESSNKPFCDNSHLSAKWNPRVTAKIESLLDNAIVFSGESVSISSNEQYCSKSCLCEQNRAVWSMIEQSENLENRKQIINQANLCPSGSISAWDNTTQLPFEPKYNPSVSVIEDKTNHSLAPLWIRGGIVIERFDKKSYEIRNRVTLCRCGGSSNKPFCDGSHIHKNR